MIFQRGSPHQPEMMEGEDQIYVGLPDHWTTIPLGLGGQMGCHAKSLALGLWWKEALGARRAGRLGRLFLSVPVLEWCVPSENMVSQAAMWIYSPFMIYTRR